MQVDLSCIKERSSCKPLSYRCELSFVFDQQINVALLKDVVIIFLS